VTGPSGLTDFLGRWRLDRTIETFDESPSGVLSGEAVLRDLMDHVIYEETGRLTLDFGQNLETERRYQWLQGKAGRIDVKFADGRCFHTISLTRDGEATHDCPPDLYKVRYDFGAWPYWSSEWRVTGPRKDYRMLSHYRPIS
jgi:hypothetical protein